MSVDDVERAARALRGRGRFVIAVSGGRDSMVLLDAIARCAPDVVAIVATFDHRTGAASADAAALVRARSRSLGLPVTSARAREAGRSEAALRAARWSFLRAVAARYRAPVVTAHTRDDQLETVLMRLLRGAGARGLAGLRAPTAVVRPLVGVARADVAAYALARRVPFAEDPSNASLAFFRNRIRHELLPALLGVRPQLARELLEIAERAAAVRRALDEVVDHLDVTHDDDESFVVASASLSGYDPRELCMLWPAIAARIGVTLDRRGTERLARFTTESKVGDRMQLSGPVDVIRRRDAIALLRRRHVVPTPAALTNGTVWGRWRFHIETAVPADHNGGVMQPSSALLDARAGLRIRAWKPGDRMRAAGDAVPRRVRRFLRDAGLVGPDREGWPVVLAGDDIVWIPGVRRSDAATIRPGRPGALYVCDRIRQHDES